MPDTNADFEAFRSAMGDFAEFSRGEGKTDDLTVRFGWIARQLGIDETAVMLTYGLIIGVGGEMVSEVRPEDDPQEFQQRASILLNGVFTGALWMRRIEARRQAHKRDWRAPGDPVPAMEHLDTAEEVRAGIEKLTAVLRARGIDGPPEDDPEGDTIGDWARLVRIEPLALANLLHEVMEDAKAQDDARGGEIISDPTTEPHEVFGAAWIQGWLYGLGYGRRHLIFKHGEGEE